MRVLAIIPARAGSKGIPRKNTYPILGKPLIEYTIEIALACKTLNTVLVSSDDPQVFEIVNIYHDVVLHRRSSDIANDNSPISQTIASVLSVYNDEDFDAIMLLQPTSPIRNSSQIDNAIKIFENEKDANSLISVCAMDDVHPARMYWKNKNDFLDPIMPDYEQFRRQDIPQAYYRNGSIYIVRIDAFNKYQSVMAKPCIGFEMPETQLLNIDTPRDLLVAETLIKAWKEDRL
jgi:CMP-N,N'-diacetyllegionaminic acid synthase